MVQASHSDIPLFIGVCDADEAARSVVGHALSLEKSVVAVEIAGTIEESQVITQRTEINTIFIDPLSLGLNEASELIFSIRRNSPEIVFVLYTDMSAAEENRKEFFRGERGRFSHYYTLDKNTPVAAFQDELGSILHTCQSDLGWRMSKVTLERLLSKAKQLSDPSQKTSEELALLRDINRTLTVLWKEPVRAISQSRKKTVFVSHRFADKEYVEGLIRLLEQTGFEVVTGRLANTYISKAIVERIRACEFFVCIMTRDQIKADGTYTTSPWLLEEKGVALAFGKPLVLMVEEGVTDYGGLQGDWQRIHFGAKGFLQAALDAVEQLLSYSGGEPSRQTGVTASGASG